MASDELTPAKPAGFGANYYWAAAPQAIEAEIEGRKRKARRLARELLWLENLLSERNAQIEAGDWPPLREDHTDE